MDFKILGPLEAYDGGRPLALGGPKQRAVLALLLLHANEVVSSDRLIRDVWGEARLEDASKALQVTVSRLRRALHPGRSAGQSSDLLVTRPPGYALLLERDQLDLLRFEDEVNAGTDALGTGDARAAARALAGALAQWRGPPLSDLAYEPFLQPELSRLEELRARAVEERVAADLELGRHANLVAELQELVHRHPLRERLREQLMLALYRSGRQADALEVYQDARRTLTEELGIEPCRELRELQQDILRQDRALDQAAERDVSAEPSRGLFVGRERELDHLRSALDSALSGHGRLVLVAGEPGIGKSRLADEVIGQARARGARVIVGRCWEAGGAPAYWPWVQSLRAYVRETEPAVLHPQLGAATADLAQLLPELRERFPELPEPTAIDAEGARFRLFDAVTSFLRSAARNHPLVLMLDDLHAADEPSLLLLRFVARDMADSRLLVVCALRDVDPTMREPLTSTLAELLREPHTSTLALAGISRADVAEYIAHSTGNDAAPGLAQAIHTETEGNPLFVAEVVRLLAAEDRLADPDAHLRIPPGVRAVIGQRVRRLSPRCRDLLVPAAVLGREFGLQSLAQLSDLGRGELLDALDEAVTERVVGDVPGSPGRLRFGHALIRDTLYDELSAARRMQLHQEAGEALEAVYGDDLEPHLAELAHHFCVAAPAGLGDKAADYARRAGQRAARQLAHEEAVRLNTMALDFVAPGSARCDLLLALGDAEARAGDVPAARRWFVDAAELAEQLGLPEQLAHAALGYGGRVVWDGSRGDIHQRPLLERALTALGEQDSALRVRLLTRLVAGPLRVTRAPPEQRRSLSEEALAMARRVGDPGTLAYALAGYNAANHCPALTHKQAALATELIEVAIEAGDLEREWEGHEYRAMTRIELGDLDGAKADLAVMTDLAKALRQPSQEWFAAVYLVMIALLEGRIDEAEDLIAVARRIGERARNWNVDVTYGLQLFMLRRQQGRLDDVEDLVRSLATRYASYPICRCVLASLAAELGHEADAREVLEALAPDRFAIVPFDEVWLVNLTLLAETASRLGDTDSAAVLYQLLLPYADRVAVCPAEISTGSVARYVGLLAMTIEHWDDADRHLAAALETNARIGARTWLAHTHVDRAALERSRPIGG